MAQSTEIFKALADETRLRIVHLLLSAGTPLCCCELTDSLGESQYKISKHTKILKQVGLIEKRKEGRWVYFSVAPAADLFTRSLYRAIISIRGFQDEVRKDEEKLRSRLDLRVGGKCVLGSGKR